MNIIPAGYTEYALLPYYDMPHVLLHVHAEAHRFWIWGKGETGTRKAVFTKYAMHVSVSCRPCPNNSVLTASSEWLHESNKHLIWDSNFARRVRGRLSMISQQCWREDRRPTYLGNEHVLGKVRNPDGTEIRVGQPEIIFTLHHG